MNRHYPVYSMLILAENEETMQALLKKVGDWCSVWGISVNSNKSAVLHFLQPTLPLTDAIFTLGVMQIPIVKRYRSYVTFKSDYNETEGYIQRTRVKAHRSLLAHLRGGTAPLQIELGRSRLCNVKGQ